MSFFTKIMKALNAASGRKMVTYVGLLISSVAAVCLQFGEDWLTRNVGEWFHRACGGVIFMGAFITAFGKGLADRRVDPEVQQVADEERREPTDDG